MLLTIGDVLSGEALAQLSQLFPTLAWEDGAKTAGGMASLVKSNLQADLSSRSGTKVRSLVEDAVKRHSVVKAAAQPARFSRPVISRTGEGGGYGLHIDNPFMPVEGGSLRTDLSWTLFLSDPNSYEGGELSIELSGETRALKLAPGDLVLYPSTSLHEVRPVTRGERLVAIGWIESRVKDAEARDILFDLENLAATLSGGFADQSPERLVLAKSIARLKRLWG